MQEDLPASTRAMRVTGENLEDMSWETVPLTLPRGGEALVRVSSVSLNYRDLMTLRRQLPRLPAVPYTPLTDAAGTVVAIGPEVDTIRVGERVATAFQPDWLSGPPRPETVGPAGHDGRGVLADHILRPAASLVSLPETMDFTAAACLPCAGVTAWNAVMVEGAVRPGADVVIQGTGGVSLFALGFAKAAGARVLVTSSSDDKLARATALGADVVINYESNPAWAGAVIEATQGTGAAMVLDIGGAETLGDSVAAAAMNARIVVCGLMTGTLAELPLHQCIARHLSIRAVSGGSRASFVDMLKAMEQHELRPAIDRVYSRDEVIPAFERLEGRHIGKVCIDLRAR